MGTGRSLALSKAEGLRWVVGLIKRPSLVTPALLSGCPAAQEPGLALPSKEDLKGEARASLPGTQAGRCPCQRGRAHVAWTSNYTDMSRLQIARGTVFCAGKEVLTVLAPMQGVGCGLWPGTGH